ncbi:hypothetical protein HBI56_059280 [Parastagonospora nodorum]|nr:hypothetical protein HBH53_122570 [Parastagonospora nodorum]KAH4002583.1 hypothetical protein HBI10_072130 [Parastagonospora nodorum]KAH4018086.1 hypothetical protein HBI13_139020 [Parastagonospora nodorum]KAH4164134.1 hypothetical protein HBH43_151350 [Parastagonospora nodorum]KAH4347231.1 hypothetical protein HBH98_090810 [Parastagonospora nodorum]
MAFNWSFPMQPYAVYDTRDDEVIEPAFVHPFDNFYESEEIFESFHSLSVEPWAGLGCTCELSFITCDEHNNCSAANKRILEEQFALDSYPSDSEIRLLSHRTDLSGKAIKTWFSNTRSRRLKLFLSQEAAANTTSGHVHTRCKSGNTSLMSSVSSMGSWNRDRLSSKSSSSSLERFLSAPISEDGASPASIKAALQDSTIQMATLDRPSSIRVGGSRSLSIADSESSVSSTHSYRSSTSLLSMDSRGSRRGRKQWRRVAEFHAVSRDSSLVEEEFSPPHSPYPSPPETKFSDFKRVDTPEIRKDKLFCTSPSCSVRFQFRSDWVRHEEAVHHMPYYWICCRPDSHSETASHCLLCGSSDHTAMQHCHSCLPRDIQARTFFREDLLAQHIKRSHLGCDTSTKSIPKYLLNCWKAINPSLNDASLHCGFCGITLSTWEARQEHVFEHIKKGICKESWWPKRLSETPTATFSSKRFQCPTCSLQFRSFTEAVKFHPTCVSWSCRYLHDCLSSAQPHGSDQRCRLCQSELVAIHDAQTSDVAYLRHARNHRLRDCEQSIFTDPGLFAHHLESEHAGSVSNLAESDLVPWQRVQFLEIDGGKGLVRTGRPQAGLNCCPDHVYVYTIL